MVVVFLLGMIIGLIYNRVSVWCNSSTAQRTLPAPPAPAGETVEVPRPSVRSALADEPEQAPTSAACPANVGELPEAHRELDEHSDGATSSADRRESDKIHDFLAREFDAPSEPGISDEELAWYEDWHDRYGDAMMDYVRLLRLVSDPENEYACGADPGGDLYEAYMRTLRRRPPADLDTDAAEVYDQGEWTRWFDRTALRICGGITDLPPDCPAFAGGPAAPHTDSAPVPPVAVAPRPDPWDRRPMPLLCTPAGSPPIPGVPIAPRRTVGGRPTVVGVPASSLEVGTANAVPLLRDVCVQSQTTYTMNRPYPWQEPGRGSTHGTPGHFEVARHPYRRGS
jgi:hypothetical protein